MQKLAATGLTAPTRRQEHEDGRLDDPGAASGRPSPRPRCSSSSAPITRLLHDTLQQLGVMPKLQVAADGLPDARSRLNYIANKTGEAADKVLNSVDQAKAEHQPHRRGDAPHGRGDRRRPGARPWPPAR